MDDVKRQDHVTGEGHRYERPQLQVHGTVAELVQAVSTNISDGSLGTSST